MTNGIIHYDCVCLYFYIFLVLFSRSLQWRWGLEVACCRVRGTDCSSACMGPVEGGAIIFITSTMFGLRSNNKEGTQPHPSKKIGWKIYWAWPRPSEQDPVSPSVSLFHQEVSISLLSFSIRGQTNWKPQSQKTNQTDHMDHSPV